MTEKRNKFSAEVRDVFSGDDLSLMLDLGIDDLHKRQRVRLYGVDAPNAIGQGPDTEAGKVRSFVFDMLKRRELIVTVVRRSNSTHGNLVGIVEVITPDGVINLNDALIAKGYKFKREKGM